MIHSHFEPQALTWDWRLIHSLTLSLFHRCAKGSKIELVHCLSLALLLSVLSKSENFRERGRERKRGVKEGENVMIVKTICITNTSFLTNIIRFCIPEKVVRKEKKGKREREKRWNLLGLWCVRHSRSRRCVVGFENRTRVVPFLPSLLLSLSLVCTSLSLCFSLPRSLTLHSHFAAPSLHRLHHTHPSSLSPHSLTRFLSSLVFFSLSRFLPPVKPALHRRRQQQLIKLVTEAFLFSSIHTPNFHHHERSYEYEKILTSWWVSEKNHTKVEL